jgi:uncharacterized protein
MRNIPPEQIHLHLKEENPWWQSPHKVHSQFAEWDPRPYLSLFYPLMKQRQPRRAVILMGPRRVGKTVMIHHAIQKLLDEGIVPKNICYISVDHPLYNGLSIDELLEAYEAVTGVNWREKGCHVFLDEIQYMRDWEQYLKTLIDRHHAPKFVASGSAAAALRMKSKESGAGRFTDFLLPPLTFYEYLNMIGRQKLISVSEREDEYGAPIFSCDAIDDLNTAFISYLNYGGYPEVALSRSIQEDPGRFIKSDIIDKVLLRDLPSLYGISDVQELNRLFTTLSLNTGGEVSLKGLSNSSGISKNTIRRYLDYLEAAFLIQMVRRVDDNARRFKRRTSFKVYLTNPSMRTALFAPLSSDSNDIGHLVETGIFAQWFHSNSAREHIHYARWKRGEVDIVSLQGNLRPAWATEVKWSDRAYEKMEGIEGLLTFCAKNSVSQAKVTTRTRTGSTTHGNTTVSFQPASLYAYELGHNIIAAKQRLGLFA